MSVQEEQVRRALARGDQFVGAAPEGLRVASHSTHLLFHYGQQLDSVFHPGCVRLFSRTRGKLSGEVSRVTFEHLAACFLRLDQASLSRAIQPEGRFGLLLQLQSAAGCLWNGFDLREPSIVVYGPGSEHAGLQTGGAEGVYLSMSLKRLGRMLGSADRQVLKRLETGCHRVNLPAYFFGSFYQTLLQVKAATVHRPEMLEHVEVRRPFEASIEQSLLQVFASHEQWSAEWQAAPAELVRTVGRVEEFARLHPFERLTSRRVLHALNLDRRHTDRAFQALFRESLGRYLKLLWFDQVQTALRRADANAKGVRNFLGRRRLPFFLGWRHRRLFGAKPEQSFGGGAAYDHYPGPRRV
ncbi:MAG TPA: hypothetical protein VGD78_23270 [Chthoniobacterales bacterium]